MATKEDVLKIIQELEYIKEHLIPLNRVLDENEDHITLYHDKKIEEMDDNQVINYYNVSQTLFPMMDTIYDYIQKLKDYTSKEYTHSLTYNYLIINSDIETNLKKVTNEVVYGPTVLNYKASSIVKTYIDEIVFDLSNFKVTKNNNEVATTPIVYVFNLFDKSVKMFDKAFTFNVNCTQEIMFVGIKLKEKVKAGDMLKINPSFKMKIYLNNMNIIEKDLKLFPTDLEEGDTTTFFSTTDIEFGQIPFFSIIDIFGNNLKIKFKEDTDYIALSNNITINNSDSVKRVKMLSNAYSTDYAMNVSLLGDFVAIKGKSFFYQPIKIGFNVYYPPDYDQTIYFPSLAKLSLVLKRVINEL